MPSSEVTPPKRTVSPETSITELIPDWPPRAGWSR
jgi:hypothetical protein